MPNHSAPGRQKRAQPGSARTIAAAQRCRTRYALMSARVAQRRLAPRYAPLTRRHKRRDRVVRHFHATCLGARCAAPWCRRVRQRRQRSANRFAEMGPHTLRRGAVATARAVMPPLCARYAKEVTLKPQPSRERYTLMLQLRLPGEQTR